jgi:NDP-sugar pyrophosphorylase family protein
MVRVGGKPLLEWVINWLKRNNLNDVIIGVAYKKNAIIDYFGDGKKFGVNIRYSEHTVEGGTGEGFRLGIERYVNDDHFLATNGDEITDIDVNDFARFHFGNAGIATIALSYLRSPFGTVEVNDRNDIISFREKPVLTNYLVSTGVYIFQNAIRKYLPVTGNIESETFPKLSARRELKGYLHTGFWGTVNTAKDLQELEMRMSKLSSTNVRPAH